MSSPFWIEPFRPGQEEQVLGLILPIQQGEFGVPITAADQPDLTRIPEVYQAGRGGFWVGLAEGQVVGTVDEDFAVESMKGEIFLLGNTSWLIRRIEGSSGKIFVEETAVSP